MALHDLTIIDGYYLTTAPASSFDINHRIVAAAQFLSETPFAGPLIGDRDRRKWRVRNTPYILIYRVLGGQLRILRVFHTSRDPRSR
ncbi:type II toxin-antitoxin system RelE/ParE family toxin [Sphingomonas aurea]|uniref:type II toxin-antitoxin system RelE/ParE family toxin n=1 Tax=Sphingomonas aurea TaxID=3063994 RepID=UPI00351CDE3B